MTTVCDTAARITIQSDMTPMLLWLLEFLLLVIVVIVVIERNLERSPAP